MIRRNRSLNKAGSRESSPHLGSFDTFNYDTLDSPSEQIRLIRLLDTKQADKLTIEISTWHASDVPEYVAISYTWGDERDLCSVSLNERTFTIRQNCRFALQQVRNQRPTDYIWIDSLCINQDDVQEKSSQVSKMADVYANAKCVCICVGPHANQSELLIQYGAELKAVNEKLHTEELTGTDFKHLDNSSKDGVIDPYPERSTLMLAWEYIASKCGPRREYVEAAVSIILAFTRRVYWTRLWIIQEIAFAKSKVVLCGNHVLEWELMELFQDLTWNFFYQTHFSTMMYYGEPQGASLAQAMRFFAPFHCSDVRDHLFGILGLIHWTPEDYEITAADYSLGPYDVLLRVISSLDCHTPIILQAFKVFNINSQSPESQYLLQHGRAGGPRERPAARDRSEFLSWLQTWRLDCDVCQIDEDESGKLVANFIREPRENFCYVESPEYSLYPYRDGKTPSYALPVYSRTSLAGLTCTKTKKGDLLACIWTHRSDVLLVLRHFQDDMYTIVGQALSVNGFSIEKDSDVSDARMLLSLSAEELFLLWSQDYVGDDTKTLNKNDIFDPEAHLQRLRTDVVLFPDILLPRVRISLCVDDY